MSRKVWLKEDYLKYREGLTKFIVKNGIGEVGQFCCLNGLPLVVAYEFILEDMPEHKEECEYKIKCLTHFYSL